MLRRISFLLVGIVAALLALELVLRSLPVPAATSVGQYLDPRVSSYPPGLHFRTATGWSLLNAQSHVAGRHGYIPSIGERLDPASLGLVGDSLVEQSMLPVSMRLASILEQMRGEQPVVSLGLPGSSLFDYLERMRFARQRLGIESFWVLVEQADVRQSLCRNETYSDACMNDDGTITYRIRANPGLARRWLAQSALLQYFVGVLSVSPSRLFATLRPKRAPVAADGQRDGGQTAATGTRRALSAGEALVISRFVEELRQFGPERVALLIDPRISDLKRSEAYSDPGLELLSRTASEAGYTVVHPLQVLAESESRTGLSMRVGPYDAHWNVRANCVIARSMLGRLHPLGESGPATTPAVCSGV